MDPGDEIRATIAELRLRADPGAWARSGFAVVDGRTRIGSVPVAFGAERGWTLSGPASADFDGLPTKLGAAASEEPAPEHPIGALSIDHVVVFTPSLERTTAAFERNGIRCRRVREVGPEEARLRQGFFRLGEVIAEVVQVPPEQAGPDGAARFWGLTITVADIDGAAAELGPLCGTVRDAVQSGRRIATLKREAGLGLPVALISPEVSPDAAAGGRADLGPVSRRP